MNDNEEIKNLTHLYTDSMRHSSAKKVKDAFHSNRKVVGVLARMGRKGMPKLNVGNPLVSIAP